MHLSIEHPLIESLVNKLRDTTINAFIFRQTVKEVSKLLLYEAMRNQKMITCDVKTWRGDETYRFINEKNIMVVSVLRAALPMHEALIDTLYDAESGFLGIKRDEETHQSVLYYDRVGVCEGKDVILVDPMVATGGSLCDAIKVLKEKNAGSITSLNIIGSPEGIAAVQTAYPEVNMLIAKIDEKLNNDKYIIPGLGDAGDRAYNTL